MAHRYWRVRITRAHVTPITATEVEFRSTPGGADQTGSGIASASAGLVVGTTAANAFDNNIATNTNFAAVTTVNGMNEWLAYDFGAGNEKDIVEFAWTIGPTASRNPRDCLLEYSDDAVTWTPYGLPFVDIAAALSSTTTVYTASGTDVVVIPKMGSFVVGALWPFDAISVGKAGYQIVLEAEGAVVAKQGYFAVIGPTDGIKVADFSAYVAFERLPSIQVADINGYVVFRTIPTPPRKTIVIIGPGQGFGGSGVDNPLIGHIVQDEEFSAMLRLPQNMAGDLEQNSVFDADLFVDNEVEDIFLLGDLEQTSEIDGSLYIPHFFEGAISQESVFDADLTVDDSVVDHFLEGAISQAQTTSGSMSFTVAMQGDLVQTSVVDGNIDEILEGAAPDEYANLIYWFDADDAATLTKTGNLVDVWEDKSTTARDAASTGTARPDHGTNTINGKPVVTLSAATEYLQAAWSSVTDMTHTVVLRTTSTVSHANWYLSPFIFGRDASGVANDFAIYMSDGYVAMQVRDAANPIAKTLARLNDGEAHVVTISRSAAGVEKIYVDGVLETTGTLNTAAINALTNVRIGNGFVGDIAEIFSYSATRSDAEVLALHDYAMDKWFVASHELEGIVSQTQTMTGDLSFTVAMQGDLVQTNTITGDLTITDAVVPRTVGTLDELSVEERVTGIDNETRVVVED